jgi:hypothetical protein
VGVIPSPVADFMLVCMLEHVESLQDFSSGEPVGDNFFVATGSGSGGVLFVKFEMQ